LLCPECLDEQRVAFSCKSQFCLSCAKVYGQEWVETVKGMLHPGVTYRPVVLTVPEGLRPVIYQHAAELLDGLMQAAQAALDEAMAVAKRQPVQGGYIVVLQTAGRAATYNPHLHVLMTDGGLTGEGAWQTLGYIPYELLHRQWQAQVLAMVERRLAGDRKAQAVVAEMRRRYPKGFVAHLQGDVLPRLGQLTRYIVKYVVSPPMALSRILHYDRARGAVTYWYRDHLSRGKKTETVSRATFIGRMVPHTRSVPKGFQRIRYYRLQATCTLKKVREQIVVALQGTAQWVLPVVTPVKQHTYRERMKATLGRDPQVCPQCGVELWLWIIWHPKYGVLYDAGEQWRAEAEANHEQRRFTPVERRGAGLDGGGRQLSLPLFALSP